MKRNYRCWAEVDLNALRGNLAWIRHRVGPEVKVITVVKADAYGHGLKQIAGLLMQSGTDVFGVANLAEAAAIRSVGKGWPILMLGACLPDEVESAVCDRVMPTISSIEEGRWFSKAAIRLDTRVRIHIKVDTGMGRLGVAFRQAAELIRETKLLPGLEIAGLYTHYASAEEDPRFSREQLRRFTRAIQESDLAQQKVEFLHVNNSAAILFEPRSVYNTVRPGLLVYGVVPPGGRPLKVGLSEHVRPALSWKCRVSFVKMVPAKTPLSYGTSFVTRKQMRVATITAGYGDGYLRAASNRAKVIIGGRLCAVLGCVTMDQMLVDVTRVEGIAPGNEVILIGQQNGEQIGVTELAKWCRTIPWEVLTNINYRVPRAYLGQQAS